MHRSKKLERQELESMWNGNLQGIEKLQMLLKEKLQAACVKLSQLMHLQILIRHNLFRILHQEENLYFNFFNHFIRITSWILF